MKRHILRKISGKFSLNPVVDGLTLVLINLKYNLYKIFVWVSRVQSGWRKEVHSEMLNRRA